jgi:predicted dehydrogenase
MKSKSRFTRRTFLKGAAAAALPAIVPSSVLAAAGNAAPSNRITLGLIGAGGRGVSVMKNFMGHDGVHVLGVCDVDKAHLDPVVAAVNRHQNSSDCKGYADFRELTARDDIDAVLIATPDHWHVLQAVDAARNGKDIYVEKPMAYSLHEGRVLSDTVAKEKRVLQTGSQQRSDARFRLACELVRNGRIGRLHTINVGIPANNKTCEPTWEPQPVPEGFDYNMWLGPAPWAEYHEQRCHYTFRFILDYSGGQVTNFGAHNLDIAQWALDMDNSGPIEISGNGEFPTSGLFTTATKVHFECLYENGVRLTCRTGRFGIYFEGSAGTIYVDRKEIRSVPGDILEKGLGENDTRLYESNDHVGNFLECMRTREQPICNAEVGHRSSSICNLGNIAMILGREKLRWDPEKEEFPDDAEANAMVKPSMREPWTL